MPEIAFRQLTMEYLSRRFSENPVQDKIVNIAFYSDRIMMLSSLEIAQKKATGSVANYEDILHTSIYNFIIEEINKEYGFLDKTIDEQKTILIDIAKAKSLEINPVIDVKNTILNAIAGG